MYSKIEIMVSYGSIQVLTGWSDDRIEQEEENIDSALSDAAYAANLPADEVNITSGRNAEICIWDGNDDPVEPTEEIKTAVAMLTLEAAKAIR